MTTSPEKRLANAEWVKSHSEMELKFLQKIKDDVDAMFQKYIDEIGGSIDVANKILGEKP